MKEDNRLWVMKVNRAIKLYPYSPQAGAEIGYTTMNLPRSMFPDLVEGGVIEVELNVANKVNADQTYFEARLAAILDPLAKMLSEKNKSYGDSALNPVKVFSQADAVENIKISIDHKLSRLARGAEYANEDTVTDLIGYLLLLKMALKEE